MADQMTERRRALTSKIVETIVGDPAFREQLVQDARKALETRGLWDEYNHLSEALTSQSEVSGYTADPVDSGGDSNCCGSY